MKAQPVSVTKLPLRLITFPIHSSKFFLMLIQALLSISLMNCNKAPKTLFRLLPSGTTGVDFANTITETDSFNILTHEYIYNGGGVAVADFNNDGLPDLFFTGNEVPNKLYLNKGDLQFEDVSHAAKINIDGRWNSGVVVVDINNDGWQDLYVTATMKKDSLLRANMLFVNKGNSKKGEAPVFEELAPQYGIADTGYSTMAAFFDYDLDGDLDLYVLTNEQLPGSPAAYRDKINDGTSPNTDRLYRNNGDGKFTNVSKEAGIIYEGFGLGLGIADFNEDNWPDIYVSNDFISNDILYMNNHDGTFTDRSTVIINHQSHSSMGNDIADFDNDGLPDVITLDMLPETNSRKKTTIPNKSYLTYINNDRYDYDYQYVRNMLHKNNGAARGEAFSEIGQLAGVHQTEWSWSPLFADFDNDGNRDLFVTNGFPKDITDKDFSNYRVDFQAYVDMKTLVDSIPVVRIPNYAFRNNGDLTFNDVSKSWGLDHPSFSNGAAFADLDNDGDLDYITNNINEEAFIFENTLYSKDVRPLVHFLRITLDGPSSNLQSIGTKVFLYYDSGRMQYAEQQVARGYLSSVEDIVHFGLGNSTTIDSLRVVWPDGKSHKIENVKADQLLAIKYDSMTTDASKKEPQAIVTFLRPGSQETRLLFRHDEQDKIDYNLQRTLPHKFTQSGPSISVGDVNNDERDDVLLGGSSGHPITVFTQQSNGTFTRSEIVKGDNNIREDEGLLLFDADGDGDQDLYTVSGSIEHEPASGFYQHRFFRNNGKGKFELDASALPEVRSSGSCVRAADFDGDKDLDLFIGGRVVTASYPLPAESFLLHNENGKFINATNKYCPELSNLGMITDALFTDFNNDGNPDLVIVGEFLPITFFSNKDGKFNLINSSGIENLTGWWNSIVGGDFDGDGDIDYVAGNLGMNNGYQVTKDHPLKVYAKDFDKNGSVDAILACYIKESLEKNEEKKLYPVHFWDELNSQSPKFRQQFSRYKTYGGTTMENLLSAEDLQDALILQANHFESSYVENLGNEKFKISPLPRPTQFAPINGMIADDINRDGNLDILMVGNDYGNEVFVGRYDAFKGGLLLGDGRGNFEIAGSLQSGFWVGGDAKGLAKFYRSNGEEIFAATQNRDSLKVFIKDATGRNSEMILVPEPLDSWAELIYGDGRKSKIEFYYGSGYLSQSSRKIRIPEGVREIIIYDYSGKVRRVQQQEKS